MRFNMVRITNNGQFWLNGRLNVSTQSTQSQFWLHSLSKSTKVKVVLGGVLRDRGAKIKPFSPWMCHQRILITWIMSQTHIIGVAARSNIYKCRIFSHISIVLWLDFAGWWHSPSQSNSRRPHHRSRSLAKGRRQCQRHKQREAKLVGFN